MLFNVAVVLLKMFLLFEDTIMVISVSALRPCLILINSLSASEIVFQWNIIAYTFTKEYTPPGSVILCRMNQFLTLK